MTTTAPSNDDCTSVWNRLASWVRENGGTVHPALTLRLRQTNSDRGVVCTSPISQGQLLFQLPQKCVVGGEQRSSEYLGPHEQLRRASPWLRCLAALCQAQNDPFYQPYQQSLPTRYKTVWEWTEDEIDSYLAGTAGAWKFHADEMRDRYRQQIRPYLGHEGLILSESSIEEEHEWFYRACQCLSTRGFHTATSAEEAYPGPFLLPAIDLLNHSTTHKCTTLHRSPETGDFLMRAERDLRVGDEVFHSYGDELSSSQFLQSFGFVPRERVAACLDQSLTNCSPAVLSQNLIRESVQRLLEEGFPAQIAQSVDDDDGEEIWEIGPDFLERNTDFLPDQVLVTRQEPLTSELVTLCCAYYLPLCAYSEVRHSLLDESILDDYFLGKLVCGTLLRAVQTKLSQYSGAPRDYDSHQDAQALLASLWGKQEEFRKIYGLCVILEEKESLAALVREVSSVLERLDGDSGKRMRTM